MQIRNDSHRFDELKLLSLSFWIKKVGEVDKLSINFSYWNNDQCHASVLSVSKCFDYSRYPFNSEFLFLFTIALH